MARPDNDAAEDRRHWLPLVLAALLVAIGFTQLDRYNVTWDEALGDLFFGQRYLSYFTSFDSRYLDYEADPYPAGFTPDLRTSEFRKRPWEYWPMANMLAAATSRVLANGLGLVDPFDGYHAFNLFAGAVLLVALYRFVARAESEAAAIVTVALLFLMPRIVADLMANIKDFPEMVFFSLTLLGFFTAYERGSLGGIIASGVIWGFALGTKANAWFIPFVVIIFVLARGIAAPWKGREMRLGVAVVAAAAVGIIVMIASWPWMWPAPFARLRDNLTYVSLRSLEAKPQARINAWEAVVLTTPPVILLLAAASIPMIARRALKRDPAVLFLLAWSGVVAMRISFGTTFDGVRHFLELFPPIAGIAGIGAAGFASRIASGKVVVATLLAVPILATAYATVASHPFETAYWNGLAGGLSGAQRRQIPQACDYWGASYRLGLEWINANAPRRALLFVPMAGHTVKLVAPARLRPDIYFIDYPRGGGVAAAAVRMQQVRSVSVRYSVYVMFVPRRDWSTELDADCMRRLTPVKAWNLDGAPVLLIYRYRV